MNHSPDLLRGLGAAPGLAEGPAFVLQRPADMADVPSGAIVVLRVLHPHLTPIVLRAAGLVLEEGALLQHATIVAREFGIPAVVGIADATRTFQSDERLQIDGVSGEVRRWPRQAKGGING